MLIVCYVYSCQGSLCENHGNNSCLSRLQVTSVTLRRTFTTSTLCGLRSETWRAAPSCLKSPNHHMQVSCINLLLACLTLVFVLCCKWGFWLWALKKTDVLAPAPVINLKWVWNESCQGGKRPPLLVVINSSLQCELFSNVPEDDEENREVDASAGRFVRYQFTPAFLRLRTVGATWVTHTSPTGTLTCFMYKQYEQSQHCLRQPDT